MTDRNDLATVLPEKAVSEPSKGRPHAEVSGIKTTDNGKDFVFRYLAHYFQGSALFHALNLDLPPIKAFISSDLPAVDASDGEADLICLLEDGSYLIMEFDSHAGIKEYHKYMKYFVRFVDHYEKPGKKIKVRFVVVYTSDLKRSKAEYTNGPMHFTVEQCFLSAINSDGEFERIMARINRREQLDHEDISKLVILPLTKRGKPDKRQMIDQVIDAASKLKETYASDATVVLSLVTTVMRNYISKGQLEKVKEMIRMSPLGKMFYDEMEQKLEQKDIEMEQKLEQKDKEYASFLVSAIDALVQCQIKLEDACAKFGKKTTDYTAAKAMLAGA